MTLNKNSLIQDYKCLNNIQPNTIDISIDIIINLINFNIDVIINLINMTEIKSSGIVKKILSVGGWKFEVAVLPAPKNSSIVDVEAIWILAEVPSTNILYNLDDETVAFTNLKVVHLECFKPAYWLEQLNEEEKDDDYLECWLCMVIPLDGKSTLTSLDEKMPLVEFFLKKLARVLDGAPDTMVIFPESSAILKNTSEVDDFLTNTYNISERKYWETKKTFDEIKVEHLAVSGEMEELKQKFLDHKYQFTEEDVKRRNVLFSKFDAIDDMYKYAKSNCEYTEKRMVHFDKLIIDLRKITNKFFADSIITMDKIKIAQLNKLNHAKYFESIKNFESQ